MAKERNKKNTKIYIGRRKWGKFSHGKSRKIHPFSTGGNNFSSTLLCLPVVHVSTIPFKRENDEENKKQCCCVIIIIGYQLSHPKPFEIFHYLLTSLATPLSLLATWHFINFNETHLFIENFSCWFCSSSCSFFHTSMEWTLKINK